MKEIILMYEFRGTGWPTKTGHQWCLSFRTDRIVTQSLDLKAETEEAAILEAEQLGHKITSIVKG